MKKRIELREITDIFNSGKNGICICSDDFCEPLKPSRLLLKKVKTIANSIDAPCVAFLYVGSKMYALSESCIFLSRFIIFNAVESKEDSKGIRVFVRDPLTSGNLYDKKILYKKLRKSAEFFFAKTQFREVI